MSKLKRKPLTAVLIALIVVVLAAGLTFAAGTPGFWVGTVEVGKEIKEPITYELVEEECPVGSDCSVYPGEAFSFEIRVSNAAQTSYGMSYHGWLAFMSPSSVGSGDGAEVKILLQEVEEQSKGELVTSLGRITFSLDPDGPGGELPFQGYTQGMTVNISPQGPYGAHSLRVQVQPAHDLPPGKLTVGIGIYRGAPIVGPSG